MVLVFLQIDTYYCPNKINTNQRGLVRPVRCGEICMETVGHGVRK